jgi:hypothetical protein
MFEYSQADGLKEVNQESEVYSFGVKRCAGSSFIMIRLSENQSRFLVVVPDGLSAQLFYTIAATN